MIQLTSRHIHLSQPNRARAGRFLGVEIQPGEFVLVAGPSGAGEVHLPPQPERAGPAFLRRALGRPPAEVFGRDPVRGRPRAGMADLVGFVFQDPEAQFRGGYGGG